jgi:hypothetical protein
MRVKDVPPDARRLKAYAELESYLEDFAKGRYPFLWVVGRPGVAKTESLRAAVRGRDVFLQKGGQLTPLQFYINCFQHRGKPIILDDAEHLLGNTLGAKLVSALGDTTPAKQMCYATTSRLLGDTPQSFNTTSPLCIIANRNTKDEAIRSRAVTLFFDPTNLEVHRATARWFWDQEVHDWFGQHLHRLPPLEARWYVIAYRDKEARRDWRQILLSSRTQSRQVCIVQDLERDAAYPTVEDKFRRFAELLAGTKGASRATYFRLRGKLEAEGLLDPPTVGRIQLSRSRPPATPSLEELDAMDGLTRPEPEEEPGRLDVPLRDSFAQPIRGDGPTRTAAVRPTLDDNVSWEAPRGRDDGDS